MRCHNPKAYFLGKPVSYLTIIPCGHCIACRINKREEWTTRISHETLYSSSSCFITLTYAPEFEPLAEFNEELISSPSKDDVQQFIKRLRKRCGNGIRYFIGSERGPTGNRAHYHGIIWNLPQECINSEFISSVWKKGFVTVSCVNHNRMQYVAKYYVEREEFRGTEISDFSLMSLRPGIGRRYIDDNSNSIGGNERSTVYRDRQHTKVPLPRYYRNICYSDETKSKRFTEYLERQDFEKALQIRSGLGQELEEVMIKDYKSKHKKEL